VCVCLQAKHGSFHQPLLAKKYSIMPLNKRKLNFHYNCPGQRDN